MFFVFVFGIGSSIPWALPPTKDLRVASYYQTHIYKLLNLRDVLVRRKLPPLWGLFSPVLSASEMWNFGPCCLRPFPPPLGAGRTGSGPPPGSPTPAALFTRNPVMDGRFRRSPTAPPSGMSTFPLFVPPTAYILPADPGSWTLLVFSYLGLVPVV